MEEYYYNICGRELTCREDILLYIKSRLTKAEYLYGESLDIIDSMLYLDALKYKIKCSERLVKKLLAVHHMRRDGSRIQDSLTAQKFNRMLINERK